MFWFFDRMETLQRHVARGGMGRRSLRQQIEAGARCTAPAQLHVVAWQRGSARRLHLHMPTVTAG